MDNYDLFEYIANDAELSKLWTNAVYDPDNEDELYGALTDIPGIDIDDAWVFLQDQLEAARDDMPVSDIEDGEEW